MVTQDREGIWSAPPKSHPLWEGLQAKHPYPNQLGCGLPLEAIGGQIRSPESEVWGPRNQEVGGQNQKSQNQVPGHPCLAALHKWLQKERPDLADEEQRI